MINVKFIKGSVFDSKCQVITNPVNCVGVMGKGLALEYKTRFPKMYKAYKEYCKNNDLTDTIFIYEITKDRIIYNVPTKYHWKDKSTYYFVKHSIENLFKKVKENNIKSIALIPFGCGLGGLNKEIVLKYIYNILLEYNDLDLYIEFYDFT